MPRHDLKLVDSAGGYVTVERPLTFLGLNTCLVEVSSKPLKRAWLPRSCIVSQQPAAGRVVSLRVPIWLAIEHGLLKRGDPVQVAGERLVVVAPVRAEDRITLP